MSGSIFMGLAIKLLVKLKIILKESFIYKLMKAFELWLVRDMEKSSIVKIISKDEKTSFYAKYSVCLNKIQDIASKINRSLREKYTKYQNVLENSIVFQWLNLMGKDIVSVLGIFICIQMIIPEAKWHNIYNFIFVGCIVIVYIIKVMVDIRFNINIYKIDISVFAFMASIIIALVNSKFSIDSIKHMGIYISILLFSIILVNSIKNKYAFMRFIKYIIIMSTLMSIYGIYQLLMGIPVDPLLIDLNMGQYLSRVYSTMGNPNIYAGVLVLSLPFYILAYIEQDSVKGKLITFCGGMLVFCNILLTYSRTAYIALIASIVVFLILKNKNMFPILLIGMVLAIPIIPSDVITRLMTLGKDSSSIYRFNIWETSMRMIKDNWFLGIGINSEKFKVIFSQYSLYTPPSHSHMFFMQIWLELGLIGIVSFVWMVVRLIKWALKVLLSGIDKKMNNIIIANISAIVGILLFGLAENIGFGLRILYIFWTVIMLLIVSLNISGKQYKKLDMQIEE